MRRVVKLTLEESEAYYLLGVLEGMKAFDPEGSIRKEIMQKLHEKLAVLEFE